MDRGIMNRNPQLESARFEEEVAQQARATPCWRQPMPAQLLALRCEETLSGTIQIFGHRVIAACNDNWPVCSNRCSHVHTCCCCSCCCAAVSVPGSGQRPEACWVRMKSIGSNGRRVPAGGAGGCALLILAAAAAAVFAAWPTLPVVLPPQARAVSRAMHVFSLNRDSRSTAGRAMCRFSPQTRCPSAAPFTSWPWTSRTPPNLCTWQTPSATCCAARTCRQASAACRRALHPPAFSLPSSAPNTRRGTLRAARNALASTDRKQAAAAGTRRHVLRHSVDQQFGVYT